MQLQQNIDFIYLILVLLLLLYILSYFKIFSALKYKVIFIFIIFPYFLVSAICPTLRKTNDKCLSDLKSSLKSAARCWNGKQSTPLSSLCFFSRRPAFLKATFRCQCGMMQLAWSTECKKTSEPHRSRRREEVGLRISSIENAPLTSLYRDGSTLKRQRDFGKQLSQSFAAKALWAWIAYSATCNVIVYLFHWYCSYTYAYLCICALSFSLSGF